MADFTDWRHNILARIGADPYNENSLKFLDAWQQREGGNGPERFNWLNTTLGSQFPRH
jgi:hypothetical protein